MLYKKTILQKNIFILLLISVISLSFKISKAQDYSIYTNLNIDLQTLNSYVPAFYEGKALAGEGSDMKAVANIEIKTAAGIFDSSNFFYAWYYNGKYLINNSKTGGNIIFFTLDPFLDQNTLKLQVYENNTKETLLSEKIISIKARKVIPILYKKNENPLITYANAINKKYENYKVNKGETFNILAEPFYFSTKSPFTNLSYIWSINDIAGNTDDNSNTLEYKAPYSVYNDFGIGLKVKNSTNPYQDSEYTLNFILNK